MNTLSRIALAILAVFIATSSLQAQVQWNRKALKVAVQPNKDGSHRIMGFWQAEFDTDQQVDLSTTVALLVNGNMLYDGHVTVLKIADQGGGACPTQLCPGNPSCGSMVSEGIFYDLHCHQSYINNDPTQPVCSCSGPVASVAFDFDELNDGDIIEIILLPAQGGAQEINTGDDSVSTTYNGSLQRWNRRIASLNVTPRPGSPIASGVDSFFDISVEVEFQSNAPGWQNANAEVELFVNGESHGTRAALGYFENDGVCTGTGCPATLCGSWIEFGLQNGSCAQGSTSTPMGTLNYCFCDSPDPVGPIVFPAVPLDATDEVVVVLRPAPGALPELPGLPGTDEEGDDSARGGVPQQCPCEGDANGDGVVDVNDVSFVLFRLGNICNPV